MNTRDKTLWLAFIAALASACASPPSSEGEGDDQTAIDPNEGDDDDGTPTTAGDASAPVGAEGTVDCSGDTPKDGEDMLTTFEDGTVGLDSTGGWVGGFYIFNDKMNDPTAQMASVEEAPRCSDGSSQYAYCTKGAGFTVWGAGIGTDLGPLDMDTMKKATVDLSAYSGVSFWVRRNGSGTMPASAKVIIPDANTTDEGGTCTNDSDAPATMKCDPFTTSIMLSSGWTKQTVMFSTLKQGAWGKPVPDGFAKDKVYGIQLQFPLGMSFDVCVDQFVLVR